MKKMVKSLTLLACVAIAMLMPSCGSDSSNVASDLLKTVPEDAWMVTTFNGEAILADIEAEKSGDKWKFCDEFDDFIASLEAMNNEDRGEIMDLISADNGVNMNAFVLFSDSMKRVWFTGMLENPDKFKEYIEKLARDDNFVSRDDIDVMNCIAVKGNQFWICSDRLIEYKDFNPTYSWEQEVKERAEDARKEINEFAALESDNSFLANEYGSTLASMDKYAEAIVDLNYVLRELAREDSEAMYFKQGLNMLFKDANYMVASLDVDKDRVSAKLDVLNREYKPAEFAFKLKEINGSDLAEFRGKATAMVALGLSKETVDKFMEIINESMSPRELNDPDIKRILNIVSALEGTMAAAVDGTSMNMQSGKGVNAKAFVSFFDGRAASDLVTFIHSVAGNDLAELEREYGVKISAEDKKAVVEMGRESASGNASEMADMLAGKYAGFVFDFNQMPTVAEMVPFVQKFDKADFYAYDNDGGLSFETGICFKADGKNNAVKIILDMLTQAIELQVAQQREWEREWAEQVYAEPEPDYYGYEEVVAVDSVAWVEEAEIIAE